MEFVLNGEQKHYDGDPNLPLLTYLRDHEGLISPKDGCAGRSDSTDLGGSVDGVQATSTIIAAIKKNMRLNILPPG